MSVFRRKVARMILVVTGLAALVIAILVINVLRLKSKQIQVPVTDRIDLASDACADRLSLAIQFPTVSHPDPSLVHEYVPRVENSLGHTSRKMGASRHKLD